MTKLLLAAILLACAALARPPAAAAQDGVAFDDTQPDVLVLANAAHYEIRLRKSNGSIAAIVDKSTGQLVTLGSRYGCLWGASTPHGTPSFVGGCGYDAQQPNRFTYAWSAADRTLTLRYTPDPAASQRVTAEVVLTATAGPWFDLQLRLDNGWGVALDDVLFPCDTVFAESGIQEALLPALPGVALQPAFFEHNRSYTAPYPGYPGLFADYMALRSAGGNIAIYALRDAGPLPPATLGFIHDEAYVADSAFYYHTFNVRLAHGAAWTTPRVRVRVSQPFAETIRAYRLDNGLDRFPSLREKLGPLYSQVAQSPLYKADAVQWGRPFAQYDALLAQLPSPGILHPVAYQPGGHDESYPDFLPPAPAWGTTAGLAAMFQQARARGLLVMPYTNPTWWDDQSPTLQNLPAPLTITDVAVLDVQGAPLYETYGPRGGYVMSPYPAFVRQRLAQLVRQMTEDVPSDLLFEDQIGARPRLYDHNAASPFPAAYIEGWLEHTRAYSPSLLMTELGFDRLAETEAGFHGSVLLPERIGQADGWWGAGAWRPYPLATMMARDKALFYQHDLAPETMTADKATLAWNVALGYMLSYDTATAGWGNPWLPLVGALQKHVLARYADQPVTAYAILQPNVTRTTFESYTATVNWDAASAYAAGEHILPPRGFLVQDAGGSLTAGAFTAFHGASLSAGDHYLIEERSGAEVVVRQPMGADTPLFLPFPPGWQAGQAIEAAACQADGQAIAGVPVTLTARGMSFLYQSQRAGRAVAGYRLANRTLASWKSYTPLVFRD